MHNSWSNIALVVVSVASLPGVVGCGRAVASQEAAWPPIAKKWFDRAQASYHVADIEDAETAIDNALRLLPAEPEVRLLAGQVALARLELDRTLELVEGLKGNEASSVRGRALWYSGDIERAADELEALLANPDVRDPWASEVAKLARLGVGRKPFQMSGALLAVSEIPAIGRASLVVPVEVNGEPALGMIATQVSEAVIDGSNGAEPGWISLKFGEGLEVRDVPALAKDLSGVTRQLGVPIRVLLGTNLLRHLNLTFDLPGQQFVVRSFEPPPPPQATTLKIDYLRGGGMLVRSPLAADPNAPIASLLVDTSMVYPLALDDGGWAKAGVATSSLQPVPGANDLLKGVVPYVQLGAFEIPQVPGVRGNLVEPMEEALGVDLDGILGAGLLAPFRATLTAGGRTLWLEDLPPGLSGEPAALPPGDGESPAPPVEANPTPLPPGASPSPVPTLRPPSLGTNAGESLEAPLTEPTRQSP
ncbi:MAG: hypothetical protein JW751_14790 [Polyangiaceae bacterium]|nr:hypothetical protein [Polyangiaceae bacterium]